MFFLWEHGENKLKQFIHKINEVHPAIKFQSDQNVYQFQGFLISMRAFRWDLVKKNRTKNGPMRLMILHDLFKLQPWLCIGYSI